MNFPESRWVIAPAPDVGRTERLARALSVPQALAALLILRGYAEPEEAKRFLRPTLDQLHDPYLLKGMREAVGRIAATVRRGGRILVHGDYDVDGQCATALLTRVLREAGAEVVPFVPHRTRDGYDFGPAGVAQAVEHGVQLVITCDCGTLAHDAVRRVRERGIAVIVTDHHVAREVADADVVINPHQEGCDFPGKELCGTGVAFKLVQALAPELGLPEHLPWHFLDLVALATIADVVPLTGENRVLVRYGLKLMSETRWPGLRALLAVCGLAGRVRAGQVGYIVAPRLNAAGRIGEAMDGLRLLLTDDPGEAEALARHLDTLNARRQAMDEAVLGDALDVIERDVDLDTAYGLVVAREDWHPGVIGLVASRVVERLARPTVLIALEGDSGRGSGRSIPAFDLHAGLSACAEHLERFGGHRMAAGFTLRTDRLEAFRAAFNAAVREALTPEDLVPTQRIDLVLPLAALDDRLERLARHLEPCGPANPAPVWGVTGATAANVLTVGGHHLRFTARDGSGTLAAIAFGWADRVPADWWREPVDLAIRLERNEWRGESTLQARVVEIKTGVACASSPANFAAGG